MATKLVHRIDTSRRRTRFATHGVVFGIFLSMVASSAVAAPPGDRWGGSGCQPRAVLRQIIDDAFAAAPAGDVFGNGRGSGAPGYSVALSREGCGTFAYAVGVRDLEHDKPMRVRTRHHIGSLTKLLTTALVLRLDAWHAFGPDGLETSIDQFLSSDEIALLTEGSDAEHPLCPAEISTFDRLDGTPRVVLGGCPDFSQITLRHLLNGNHGLFDFLTEVDRNNNGILDSDEYALGSLFDVLGVPRQSLPPGIDTSFDFLVEVGVLADPEAVIGGTRQVDFETSFGNTGYTLLGIVAERVTGLSYDRLLRILVGVPLRLPLIALTTPPHPEFQISRQYLVTSGADLIGLPEDLFGAYPQTETAGNPVVDVYDLDAFIVTNSGGGAGAAVASPASYRRFFDALIGGRLFGSETQRLFDEGFVPIDELPGVLHGFGVFRFVDPEFGPGYAKSGRVTGSVCQLLHFSDSVTTVVACRNSADAFLSAPNPPSATPVGDLARELVMSVTGD